MVRPKKHVKASKTNGATAAKKTAKKKSVPVMTCGFVGDIYKEHAGKYVVEIEYRSPLPKGCVGREEIAVYFAALQQVKRVRFDDDDGRKLDAVAPKFRNEDP